MNEYYDQKRMEALHALIAAFAGAVEYLIPPTPAHDDVSKMLATSALVFCKRITEANQPK